MSPSWVWVTRAALGLLFVTSVTRLCGGSIWLGLVIGSGVVFIGTYASQEQSYGSQENEVVVPEQQGQGRA